MANSTKKAKTLRIKKTIAEMVSSPYSMDENENLFATHDKKFAHLHGESSLSFIKKNVRSYGDCTNL